jgi:hypothetical protein
VLPSVAKWTWKGECCVARAYTIVLGRVQPIRPACVYAKLGVFDPIRVLENLFQLANFFGYGKYSNLEWDVMTCLGTLASGPVFLVLIGRGDVVSSAPLVMTPYFRLPDLRPLRTDIQLCLGFQVQTFNHDTILLAR